MDKCSIRSKWLIWFTLDLNESVILKRRQHLPLLCTMSTIDHPAWDNHTGGCWRSQVRNLDRCSFLSMFYCSYMPSGSPCLAKSRWGSMFQMIYAATTESSLPAQLICCFVYRANHAVVNTFTIAVCTNQPAELGADTMLVNSFFHLFWLLIITIHLWDHVWTSDFFREVKMYMTPLSCGPKGPMSLTTLLTSLPISFWSVTSLISIWMLVCCVFCRMTWRHLRGMPMFCANWASLDGLSVAVKNVMGILRRTIFFNTTKYWWYPTSVRRRWASLINTQAKLFFLIQS